MESIQLKINKNEKILYIYTPPELKKLDIVQGQCGSSNIQCGKNEDYIRIDVSNEKTFYVDCRKNTHTFNISDNRNITFDDDEIIKMLDNLNNEISERIREINKKNKKFEDRCQIQIQTVKDIKVYARIVTHPKVEFIFPVELRSLLSDEVQDFDQITQKTYYPIFQFSPKGKKSFLLMKRGSPLSDEFEDHIVVIGLNPDDNDDKPIVCKLSKKDSEELLKAYAEEDIVKSFMNFTNSIRKKYVLKHISPQEKKLTTYYF